MKIHIPIQEEDDVVRIDGEPHIVKFRGADGGRRYERVRDGDAIRLSLASIRELAAQSRIVTNIQWESLGPDVHHAISTDWSLVPTDAKAKAIWRMDFHIALDAFGPHERRTEASIQIAINQVLESRQEHSIPGAPSVQQIRLFDKRWLFSGRNPKALIDLDFLKGNRRKNHESSWIDYEINKIIDFHLTLGSPIAQIEKEAHAALLLHVAAHPELPLRTRLGEDRVFGEHRVRDLIALRNFHDQQVATLGRKEARRRSAGGALGPGGQYALHEVEVDHNMLDLLVVFEGKERRAWLTVLIDRFSRVIIGFYVALEPPSWFSVAMAVRLAVQPKGPYLRSLNYDFEFDWDCYGSPDFIFADRGNEFRSATYSEICRLLRIGMMDLPRARGDLKGKIERFFGTTGSGLLKGRPGYTNHTPSKRLPDFAGGKKISFSDLERLVAIFVVDQYNNQPHSEIGETPMKRYKRSMDGSSILKYPPPPDILGSILSPARTAMLTERGISLDGLRYQSDELRRMWFNAGANVQVLVHEDAVDGTRIKIHHGNDTEWVEGRLVGPYAETHIGRRNLIEKIKAERPPKDTPEESQKRARAILKASQAMREVFGSKPIHKHLDAPPPKVATHINRPVHDPDASARAFEGYDPEKPVPHNRYDGNGPFGGPSLAEQHFQGTLREPSQAPPLLAGPAANDPPQPEARSMEVGVRPAKVVPRANTATRLDDDDPGFEVRQF